jgi:hypothetical protein
VGHAAIGAGTGAAEAGRPERGATVGSGTAGAATGMAASAGCCDAVVGRRGAAGLTRGDVSATSRPRASEAVGAVGPVGWRSSTAQMAGCGEASGASIGCAREISEAAGAAVYTRDGLVAAWRGGAGRDGAPCGCRVVGSGDGDAAADMVAGVPAA